MEVVDIDAIVLPALNRVLNVRDVLSAQIVRRQDVVDQILLIRVRINGRPDVLRDHRRRQIDEAEQRTVRARLPAVGMQNRKRTGKD